MPAFASALPLPRIPSLPRLGALALALLTTGVTPATACAQDMVATRSGCVRGAAQGSLVVFRGIPYAAPPTGPRRWRPPEPAIAWQGVRDATAFGKACPQLESPIGGKLETDEDCLTLNVWTPRAGGSKRPVMVWIHGGAFIQGGSAQPTYDASHLASEGGVVVVSINYRLGPLGFLAHPALNAEDGAHHASGNYGLLDQIAALHWVAENIGAFGGDPGQVTIFGESAGGVSVCALMASPLATGLFARAIIESAQCPTASSVPALASGEDQGVRIATSLGCSGDDPATCMRAKSVDEILHASPPRLSFLGKGEHYGLIVDGNALPATPGALLDAGKLAAVPLMIGTNTDEGTFFTATAGGTGKLQRPMVYAAAVAKLFPGAARRVLQQYDPRAFGGSEQAFQALTTDVAFTCPVRHAARVLQSHHAPIYRYVFAHVTAASAAKQLGATHGDELAFVFANLRAPTQDEQALSRTMLGYWTHFARTGDPSFEGAPSWPAYDGAKDSYLELDSTVRARDGFRTVACDLLDEVGRVDGAPPAQ